MKQFREAGVVVRFEAPVQPAAVLHDRTRGTIASIAELALDGMKAIRNGLRARWVKG